MNTKKVIAFTGVVVSGVWTSVSYMIWKNSYKRGFNDGAETILELCALEEELKRQNKNSKKFWKKS